MTLHVILPVHNRMQVTARFVEALARQTHTDYCLVLVDDGCTDETVAMVRRGVPVQRLTVLEGDGQLWWAGALQRAYEHLGSQPADDQDTVLIINDDVTFEADFLSRGLAVLAAHPHACFQAIGIDRRSGTIDRGAIVDLSRLHIRPALQGELPNCLATRGLLMRAATFRRSGGFRPRWLPHYLSDYEFTLRLQRQGTTLLVDERFTADVAFEITGIEAPATSGPQRFWAEAFSNRAKFNPKHWSAFVVMVCPVATIPKHLASIWFRFARDLTRAAWPRTGTAHR